MIFTGNTVAFFSLHLHRWVLSIVDELSKRMKNMNTGEIIIYQTTDGQTAIDVRMENETIGLTQKQIAELFGVKRPAITNHLKNIFQCEELDESSVCSILELTAADDKKYSTQLYNLDAILSVGYRVNSKNATSFRIWANKILKEYLVKGYAINQNAKAEQLENLREVVQLLSDVTGSRNSLSTDEAIGMLKVITDYTYALDTLDKYDYQKLEIEGITPSDSFHATYDNAMEAIYILRDKFSIGGLFGNEKMKCNKETLELHLFSN